MTAFLLVVLEVLAAWCALACVVAFVWSRACRVLAERSEIEEMWAMTDEDWADLYEGYRSDLRGE